MLQFTLRRLFLAVTVVGIVAALARAAPGTVGMALLGLAVSAGCFALAIWLARYFGRQDSIAAVGCLGLVAIPAFGFGIAFGLTVC
jgi:hypothetical protein